MANTVSFTAPTDYQSEQESIARRRKYAELLQQQSMEPLQQQTAGGWVVPVSHTQGLAKLAQALVAGKTMSAADTQSRELAARKNAALAEALGGMPKASQQEAPAGTGLTGGMDEGGNAHLIAPTTRTVQPSMQDNAAWLGRLSQIGPEATQIGGQMLTMQGQETQRGEDRQARAFEGEQNRVARMQERVLALDAAATQANLSREERAARATEAADLRRELMTAQQGFMESQARQAALDREHLARVTGQITAANRPVQTPVAVMGENGPEYVSPQNAIGRRPVDKRTNAPLPAPALKIQNDLLEEIGLAGSIGADVGALLGQLSESVDPKTGVKTPPALNLSLAGNLANQARNFLGAGNQESQNFASLRASLERNRNDSLRLNKGVQTEGDAVRAWNEMFQNLNDQGVVVQRLGEIQKLNERAANLKRMQIDQVRGNYGLEPLDTASFQNQPPTVGGGKPAQPGRSSPPKYNGPDRRGVPAGVDPAVWNAMTAEEKALWAR